MTTKNSQATVVREASRREVRGPGSRFAPSEPLSLELGVVERKRERVVPLGPAAGWALRCCVLLIALLLPFSSPGASDPVKRLERARVALSKDDAKGALKALKGLRKGPLADHASLLRARVLRQEGRLEEAIEAAREGLATEAPSEVRALLGQEEARAHLAQGDLLRAHRAQRQAWESSRIPERAAELMAELAQTYDAHALPGDALLLYRETWERWPLTEAADLAYVRSTELEKGTGASPPGPEQLLRLADRLRSAYRCSDAFGVYDRALAKDGIEPAARRKAEYGRADCLFAGKRYEEAIEAYARLAAGEPEEDQSELALARSHARNGNERLALRKLDLVARRADPVTRTRAQYLAAILAGPPESPQAQKRLRAVERQKAVPAFARLARWRLAWADFCASHYAAASKRLRLLAKGDLFDVEVQRALYWLAVAEMAQGNFEEGRAGLRRLVDGLPLSYYGFLAADRLGEPVSPMRSFLPDREEVSDDRSLVRAEWLSRAGFPELVRLELQSRVRTQPLGLGLRMQIARLFHPVGEHFRAVRVVVDGIGDALERGIDPAWREAWELAWPRPYRETVKRAAEEFGADPALVYAIMREESTYRAEVVSPVGARGLMQIMPPTGEQIATALGVPGFDAEWLFEPETSIRFGSYYLRELLHTFDDRPPLAIAAYNAGPEVVSTWAQDRDPSVTDVFVDSVPYAETRRYLRRVLRSYRVYGLVYGETAPAVASPQPEKATGR
jgi:soluble lytic murein transglycosylase